MTQSYEQEKIKHKIYYEKKNLGTGTWATDNDSPFVCLWLIYCMVFHFGAIKFHT